MDIKPVAWAYKKLHGTWGITPLVGHGGVEPSGESKPLYAQESIDALRAEVEMHKDLDRRINTNFDALQTSHDDLKRRLLLANKRKTRHKQRAAHAEADAQAMRRALRGALVMLGVDRQKSDAVIDEIKRAYESADKLQGDA